jgi:regulator of sigma E protease
MQDGLLIENQAMLNAGFKTGDKIIAVDGEKLPNLTMTSTLKILAKSSSNRRNHKNAY